MHTNIHFLWNVLSFRIFFVYHSFTPFDESPLINNFSFSNFISMKNSSMYRCIKAGFFTTPQCGVKSTAFIYYYLCIMLFLSISMLEDYSNNPLVLYDYNIYIKISFSIHILFFMLKNRVSRKCIL